MKEKFLYYREKLWNFILQNYNKGLLFVTNEYKNVSKYISNNYREVIAVLLLLSILISSFWGGDAVAATYTFTQTDWSGGASSNVATHGSNQNGWNEFVENSGLEIVADGDNLNLPFAIGTTTQTSNANSTSGFSLTGSSSSDTVISGTGDSASVILSSSVSPSTTFGSNWAVFPEASFNGPITVVTDNVNNKTYVADTVNNRIARFDSGSGGTTFGANWQTFGSSGAGASQFSVPRTIFVDSTNNKVYVADTANNRIARFDSGSGGTTFGANWQTFGTNGTGTNQFRNPTGIFVDVSNNKAYIVDLSNNRIARFDSGSSGTTLGANWQTFGLLGSGVNQFSGPYGISLDSSNKVYVVDSNNARLIRFDSGSGGTTFGANWQAFGTNGSGVNQFSGGVYAVSVDSNNDKVYVIDGSNKRIARFDSGSGGTTLGANWQTFGANGTGANQFNFPKGVFVDAVNNKLYVADTSNNRIARFDSGGGGTTFGANWQSIGLGGGAGSSQFSFPEGISLDTISNITYVIDSSNHRLTRFDSGSGGTTFGTNWQAFGSYGSGGSQFSYPSRAALDVANNKVYVVDQGNHRIIRFDSGSGGTTLGANWQTFGSIGSSSGKFNSPSSVVLDTDNNKVYISDYGNSRIVRFDSGSGGTTFGVNWQAFGTNGSGVNQFTFPNGIAFDSVNNKIYVSDTGESADACGEGCTIYYYRIARFDSGSGGTTFGANWQTFGDYNNFNSPVDVDVDTLNNKLYIADYGNSRVIRTDSGGGGTTLGANSQAFGAYGTGTNQFRYVSDVYVDSVNNKLYISDLTNNRVVSVDSGGGGVSTYRSSGTYTSGSIDLGFATSHWGRLSFIKSGLGTVTIKVRSSANGDFVDGVDTVAWANCSSISSGQVLSSGNCVTDNQRFIQYQATLSTSNVAYTPALESVSITYDQISSSGYLVSSIYDSEDPGNVMGGLSWTEDVSLPVGTTVAISLRTSSTVDGMGDSSWVDFSNSSDDCSKDGGVITCTSGSIPSIFRSGGDDRYFQYKITLTSTGANTPTFGSVAVTYVVNARPQFNPDYPETSGSGSTATQVTDTTSDNFGKVIVSYSVRDTDSTLGTATPGFITPSFEYNIGGGWVSINSSYLREVDVQNKSVDTTNYTEHTALWDVKSQIPGQYSGTAKIRVTINDNEGANNTASSETLGFVLDTTDPVINTFTANSVTDVISLTGVDNTNLQYRLSNNEDFSGAGEWVDASSNNIEVSISDWILTGSPDLETVYVEVRDGYGNSSRAAAVVPPTPQSLDLRDIGNANTNEYREFLTWELYSSLDNATFSKYEVYRSTNGETYSITSNITDINQNYYIDSSVATTTTYYYKVAIVDSNGDRSNYSAIVSDTPDGQGGTDFTSPTISSVTVAETQTTWVKIIWNTDEISNSVVQYSVSPNTSFSLSKTNTALVTSHSVVIDGLNPNTEYVFRVKSTDPLSNVATEDNNGSGFLVTTGGGPSITDVAVKSVDDTTATITWNTDRSSNSYVVYAGEMSDLVSGTNTVTVGNASYVESPFEHNIKITGLTSRSTYYFYIKSTDEESGYESVDNNSGSYYTFNTTYDQKAPTISDITVPIISPNAASITWVTDELADSLVEYGTAEGTYDKSSSLDATPSIYHVVTLNGLTPETSYYIRVKSSDAARNQTASTTSFSTISELRTITVYLAGGGGGASVDVTPANISNIVTKDENAFGATVAFDTSEETTAFVNFGEDSKYDRTVGSPNFKNHHEIRLFGLKGGTPYDFEVKVFDKSGNMSASTNRTFTTKFVSEEVDGLVTLDNIEQFQNKIENLIESTLPSLIPPILTDIEVTNISENSADIMWKTNIKSFGVVALVKSDKFDKTKENPYEFEMSNIIDKVKEHRLNLQSLEPGTRYNFQVRSFSIPGVVGKSKDYSFATLAPSSKTGAVKATNNSFTVSWQTSDNTSSFVEYKNLKTGDVGQFGNKELAKNHIVEVTNLPGATTFEVRYFGYTSDGIKIEGAPLRVTTEIDNKAPSINDISISSAFIPYRPNQLQTIISWKTDEPASSDVEYEEGPGSTDVLSNKSTETGEYTKEHIVIIPGFKPGTIYRVRITSKDSAGNITVIPTRTIITPVATDSVFEIIIKNFEDVFGFLKNVR